MGYGDDTYVAFLRGINVGGHHKVPMPDLIANFAEIGLKDVAAVLNTGNVIFRQADESMAVLEEKLEEHLGKRHGFAIPVMVRRLEELSGLVTRDPFKDVAMNENVRLYITFTKERCEPDIDFPFSTEDGAFHILNYSDRMVESYLDLKKMQTTKGMEMLDKLFKTDITTRNYNTIVNILNKARPGSR